MDNVYGRGLLNIEASQSPLNFNTLEFYEHTGGKRVKRSASSVRARGLNPIWEADGAYFTVFERIGRTQRDFAIPLSSLLINQTLEMKSGQESFQQFLYGRLADWIQSREPRLAGSAAALPFGASVDATVGGWSIGYSMVEAPESDFSDGVDSSYAVRVGEVDGAFSVTAGYGLGAAAFTANSGFDRLSDFDATSGVNPYLSLASGAAFLGTSIHADEDWSVTAGITSQDLDLRYLDLATGQTRQVFDNLDAYRATALNASFVYHPSASVMLSATYTFLDEANALLGVQSANGGISGSNTNALTFGASFDLSGGFDAAASISWAATHGGHEDMMGLTGRAYSSAWAVMLRKTDLLVHDDALRLSLTQPLHVESGNIGYDSVEVIDRTTGEIGPVARSFSIAGERRYVTEVSYGAPIFGGAGELSLFARAESAGVLAVDTGLGGGLAFKLRY